MPLDELKAGRALSKPAQRASVTPNVATAMASDTQRINPSRRPSAFPMKSSKSAPATGSSQEIVSSMPIPHGVLSP